MPPGIDITTEAVRLALGVQQLRAEYAAQNIARANTPGAQAVRLDFNASQSLLTQAAAAPVGQDASVSAALSVAADQLRPVEQLQAPGTPIQLDEEVANLASANLDYQALSESLSRHFGLMRLAITGKG